MLRISEAGTKAVATEQTNTATVIWLRYSLFHVPSSPIVLQNHRRDKLLYVFIFPLLPPQGMFLQV